MTIDPVYFIFYGFGSIVAVEAVAGYVRRNRLLGQLLLFVSILETLPIIMFAYQRLMYPWEVNLDWVYMFAFCYETYLAPAGLLLFIGVLIEIVWMKLKGRNLNNTSEFTALTRRNSR